MQERNITDTEIVIRAEGLTKAYTIWTSPAARLHGPILGQIGQLPFLPVAIRESCRRRSHESFRNFYALRDVSFQVGRGESVGIIGRNGSGKSTLLQMVAGTLQPTAGEVSTRGKVAALLELGSGFNPEFTGRENVYLNAAILGLSREETDAKFEQIAAFADIGDFIEQPVKTYSSGMLVRLAFAVQVIIEPEVLIVDEALSVGDVFFQQKCFERLRALRRAGTTLLFVSHDTSAVANLCERAVWLDQGRMREIGPAEKVVRRYLADAGPGLSGRNASGTSHSTVKKSAGLPATAPADLSRCQRFGDQGVRVAAFWLAQETGSHVAIGGWVEAVMLIEATRDLRDVSAGFEIRDRMGQVICGTGLRAIGQLIPELSAGEQRLVAMRFQCLLAPGKYTLDVGCGDSSDIENASDRVVGVALLNVYQPAGSEIVHGMVKLPAAFEVNMPVKATADAAT